MAHFAKVAYGYVVDVHVVKNEVITDPDGIEQEAIGQAFLSDLWGGDPNDYVQCSYNGNPISGKDRGPYAGIGYTWDGTRFEPPMPEVSDATQ